jgi:acetyl esterase/lipase
MCTILAPALSLLRLLCPSTILVFSVARLIPDRTITLTDDYRLLDLALAQSAIIVTPDYRLLPESTGLDILSDLAGFWSWIPQNLNSELEILFPGTGIQVDLRRLLVTGQSAGGYLAVQSALLQPDAGIKAVIATSPMLHLRDRYWTEAYEKPMFGIPNVSTLLRSCNFLS